MKKPTMIGAHTPKPIPRRRPRPHLYAVAREFNAAVNAWASKRGQAGLVERMAFK